MTRVSHSGRPFGRRDSGFTLIELLVVMIIIGILAAIAIPVFISQRAKAQEVRVKNDVSMVGKAVAAHWVDHTTAPQVQILQQASGYRYMLASGDAGTTWEDIGGVSAGVWGDNAFGAAAPNWDYRVNTGGWTADAWCFAVGDGKAVYKYSSAKGLEKGQCASPTAP